jgi:hypothetical protein
MADNFNVVDGGGVTRTMRQKDTTGSGLYAPMVVITDATGVNIASIDSGGRQLVNLSQLAGTAIDTNSGNKSAGTLRVVLATDQPQLTNATKVDGSAVTQPVSLTAGSALAGKINTRPDTSGGWLVNRRISTADTNLVNVKASAGQVGGWIVSNTNASPRYLKLYNKASAPVLASDTPVMTILLPGNTSGATGNREFIQGIEFTTGIAFAITGALADNDTTAIAAGEVILNLLYF